MRQSSMLVLAAFAAAVFVLPANARSEGRVSVGPVLWREDTNLQVTRATNFDGSNDTSDQQEKDWDVLGSGAGVRVGYDFARLFSLHGEVGVTQATVRDKDVVDPNQDIGSLGLNDGVYYSVGARVGDNFSGSGNYFWRIGGALSGLSTALDEDITTSWDYDETRFSFDGRLGVWTRNVGVFGGLRFVQSSADLRETDRSNLPGFQTRKIELEREGNVDFLLGAQTRGPDVAGFAEIGIGGTFSAAAGMTVGF